MSWNTEAHKKGVDRATEEMREVAEQVRKEEERQEAAFAWRKERQRYCKCKICPFYVNRAKCWAEEAT